MRSWTALRAILMKDVRHYYLKPPNINWGIIFPLAWGLMFVVRSGSPLAVREVLPGIIAMAVLFGTTSMLAVTITFEKRRRSFDRLLLVSVSTHRSWSGGVGPCADCRPANGSGVDVSGTVHCRVGVGGV